MTPQAGSVSLLSGVDQPHFATSRFEDARDYVPHFSKPFALAQPARRFSLFFSHRRHHLRNICLDHVVVDCAATFQVQGPAMESQYLLQVPMGGQCVVEQNGQSRKVDVGSAFVLNPNAPSRKLWSGSMNQMMLWLNRSAVEDVLKDELGYDMDTPLEFSLASDIDNAAVTTLVSNVVNVAANINSLAGDHVHWRVVRQLERWLITEILLALPHNYSAELQRHESQIAPYYVRRAEKYFHENLGDQIKMEDVFKITGVSQRALFYGFRQFRRTTPMAYLKLLRLEEARRQLLQAAAKGGSVTDVAMNCGFSHLSIFAREYKRRYGETPSQTLKRG